eukprot:jgi/Antlo1/1328/2163
MMSLLTATISIFSPFRTLTSPIRYLVFNKLSTGRRLLVSLDDLTHLSAPFSRYMALLFSAESTYNLRKREKRALKSFLLTPSYKESFPKTNSCSRTPSTSDPMHSMSMHKAL